MNKYIGILTAGGDSPGLNAAIRGVGKAALGLSAWRSSAFATVFAAWSRIGASRWISAALSGILTLGGTILGTSRDKPHRMVIDGRTKDMTGVIIDNSRSGTTRLRSSASAEAARRRMRSVCTRPGSTSSRCPRPLTTM